MVATTTKAKKKYDATHVRVLAATTLSEEEQRATAVLAEEARATAALIEPPLPTPTPALVGRVAPSDDDYETAVITNIHVQAVGVQNICSLISVALDLSSTDYSRWCDNVRLTLGHYSLSDHVLLDTTYVAFRLGTGWITTLSHGSGAPSPLTCRTSSDNAATRLAMPGWHWRTTSLAIVKFVPYTSTPPSRASFMATSASMTTIGR
jgi:hypothetical protein